MARVRIGVMHWDLPGWEKSYYPQDLPKEWRLNYYANEFLTVAIPQSVYRDRRRLAQLKEMLEDCHEDFMPVFYIQEIPDNIDFLSRLDRGGLHVWLDSPDGVDQRDIDALGNLYDRLPNGSHLHISQTLAGWLDVRHEATALGIHPVTDQKILIEMGRVPDNSRLLILRHRQTLREVGYLLDRFLQDQPSNEDSMILIFREDVQAADIDEIQAIVSLLG